MLPCQGSLLRQRGPAVRPPDSLRFMRFAVAVAVLVALAGCGGGGSPSPSGTVWRLDPRSGLIEGRLNVPGRPCPLAPDPGGAWGTATPPPPTYRGRRRAALVP